VKNTALSAKTRLYYIDALRVMLTILVIAHHVGQAYGPTGGAWPVQEPTRAALLGSFFTVNRSFFMSLFFMISGYFAVAAYERHGPGDFTRGRLMRLGLPTLIFGAALIPLRIFLFGERISSWTSVFDVGHLWYLEHVLLFSLGYVLFRLIRPASKADLSQQPLPGTLAILALALIIAVLSAVVRIWSPIDRWFNLLGFFKVAFADVPRDLAFFIVGLLAYPRRWFERFPTRAGMGWLAVGLVLAAAMYAYQQVLGRLFPMSGLAFGIAYLLWEGLFVCAICIGLLVLFREVIHSQGTLGRLLAENQYSAYFWHVLLVVPLQMAFLGLPLAPLPKFALVTLVAVPVVFLWSHLLRRPRFIRAVL
jgi:glucan biosynthesis protein C